MADGGWRIRMEKWGQESADRKVRIEENLFMKNNFKEEQFMSRTKFEFGPTQINKSAPVDSDVENISPFHSRS